MNSNVMIIITIGAVLVGVLGVMLGVYPVLKKKGYNIDKALDMANNVIDKADSVIKVAGQILPANPVVNVLEVIEKWAKIAVGNAEQLYHAGALSKDERKQTAQNIVYSILKELNIEVTDEKKALIDAAIENAVNDLDHAPTDVKKLQNTIEQKNNQNSQLQQENAQLKQTISTIQAATQTVEQTASTSQTAQPEQNNTQPVDTSVNK